MGVVTTSGFLTSKGLLVLSILFPKPAHFKFVKEAMRFLIALLALGMRDLIIMFVNFCAAMVGFAICVWKLVELGVCPQFLLIC